MLHTKFQPSEQSSSEEEDFYVNFIFEPNPLPHGSFGSQGHLDKLGRSPLGNASYQNFKHLSQVVLKQKIFFIIFLCISMVRTRTPRVLEAGSFI